MTISESASDRTVLVTGATGQQGGAVAARLLAHGWNVRALTRDPSSARARALEAAGAHVVAGDLRDRESVDAAVRGAYGVFSVQGMPETDSRGVPDETDEIRQGTNVADAAHAANVRHLVYSSANSAEKSTGLALLDSKWTIEQHIRSLGLSATILRPGSFMENYLDPRFGLRDGTLATALAPHVEQQLIAVADIAALAELSFEQPGEHRGLAYDLAGDELTPGEIAKAISAAIGHTVPYVQIPIEQLRRLSEDFARGYEYINAGKGTRADIAKLRRVHPGLLTFEGWLAAGGAAALAARLAPAG